jgi:ABC-type multidrug transport system fused ATPase/permease subunit
MKILRIYLKPYRWWIILALGLAGMAQILSLYDPVIFGNIIDNYALNPGHKAEEALINGVLFWLGIAVGIALAARMFMAVKDYVIRLVVQRFGMQIFNDGLRQTLRLPYQEFEDQSTGIIGPLQDLGGIILSYREAEASLQLFTELMLKETEYRPEEPIDVGEIEHLRFDNVTFRHRNASTNAFA